MAADTNDIRKTLEKQLIEAVEISLNPEVDRQLRQKAFEYIEAFKQESVLCAEVGISLFNKENSPIVRHLGLQLIEHAIKFRWNDMETLQQQGLKCTCLELIAHGIKPILEEPLHLKESLARLVVEVIKREWPQKWESLLQDLTDICNMGTTQTEITLMVFLRMAEDIINMDSHLHQARKREITQALHLHMEGLFTFFINTLKTHATSMIEQKKSASSSRDQILIHQRIAEQTLLTLHGYLDWVKVSILFMQECVIPEMLCHLLNQVELRIPACECLLTFVSRKGKFEQYQEYVRLFSEGALQFMKSAASEACTADYDGQQYLFIKRLCQVLTTLGSVQLMQMWNKERPDSKPNTFKLYLETIDIFTRLNSLALSALINNLFLAMLRSDIMVCDEDVKALMLSLLQLAKTKILRVGDPESNDEESNKFNHEDFNNSQEFDSVFTQVRSQVMDIIRIITQHFPVEAFFEAADWLIQSIAQTQSWKPSERLIQWDGVCCYMTAVMSKLCTSQNIKELLRKELVLREKPIVMLELAKSCIHSLIMVDVNKTFNDPTILASVVDTIQSLLSFLTDTQELIMDVLKKIFSLVTYNITGKPEAPWTLDVLYVRRRACSALLKMCSEYGNLLVPLFGELKEYVMSLFSGELVTMQDRTTLTEALVIASNYVGDSQQSEFIENLLCPHMELIIKNRESLTVEWLVVSLQMDKSPKDYKMEGEAAEQRSKLMLAITTLLAVVRRCGQKRSNETNCSDRSSIGLIPDGASAHVIPHILPYIPCLLTITQAVNNLYGPAGKAAMHPDYIASLGMHDTEKTAIFALQKPQSQKTTTEDSSLKTRRYIYHLTESCYTTVGLMGHAIGSELYCQQGLAWFINERVISTSQHLPNYRLRTVIRHFIKPFIVYCPPTFYETTLLPVLAEFFTCMLKRLESQWQSVNSHQTESNYSTVQQLQDQQDTYSKEVIEDQLVHLVTKDYMDVFYLACTFKSKIFSQQEERSEAMMGESDQDMDSAKKREEAMEASLGPLGEILMKSPSVNMQLLMTVFSTMTWLDSAACMKASKLSVTFIKKALAMAQDMGSLIATNVIETLYSQILMGFQVHGEAGQVMLLRVGLVLYELLRLQYPSLRDILLLRTGCSPTDLEVFEEMLFGTKPRSEKSKKDQFKKIVDNIVGKPLGQLFKDEIKIKDLPAIKFPKKQREQAENEESLGLAELFDPKNSTELI